MVEIVIRNVSYPMKKMMLDECLLTLIFSPIRKQPVSSGGVGRRANVGEILEIPTREKKQTISKSS